ncbi:hypothetical protein FOVSG1_005833 [Fusarium oxysporum f. sp. vasinfectum]
MILSFGVCVVVWRTGRTAVVLASEEDHHHRWSKGTCKLMGGAVRLTLCDRGSQSRWVVGVPDHARQPIDECPVSAIDCLVLRKVGFYPLENETKPVWNIAGDGILFVRAQL